MFCCGLGKNFCFIQFYQYPSWSLHWSPHKVLVMQKGKQFPFHDDFMKQFLLPKVTRGTELGALGSPELWPEYCMWARIKRIWESLRYIFNPMCTELETDLWLTLLPLIQSFPLPLLLQFKSNISSHKLNIWVCISGIILCMHPANERWCYSVTPSLIGWAQTQNDPWYFFLIFHYSVTPSLIGWAHTQNQPMVFFFYEINIIAISHKYVMIYHTSTGMFKIVEHTHCTWASFATTQSYLCISNGNFFCTNTQIR